MDRVAIVGTGLEGRAAIVEAFEKKGMQVLMVEDIGDLRIPVRNLHPPDLEMVKVNAPGPSGQELRRERRRRERKR